MRIANDTPYGLAAYVQSARPRRTHAASRGGCAPATCRSTTRRWTAARRSAATSRSGNGREWGEFGVNEFLEIKGIVGYGT